MSFIIDKQTLDDLNLTGKFKQGSVFSLFNRVHTRGGERLLETMFQQPLTDHVMINQRSNLFAYFQILQMDFPLDGTKFQEAENYLSTDSIANPIIAAAGNFVKKIQAQVLKDERFDILKSGFVDTFLILKSCKNFFSKLDTGGNPFSKQIERANSILNSKKLDWLNHIDSDRLSVFTISSYDHLLRSAMKIEMQSLLEIIYELDVYITVANVSLENNYGYANALPVEKHIFNAEGLRHPLIKNAVGNGISLNQNSNMIFLTGANMAGKSTLMKTIGISFYLAHLGFPIAAKRMEFSVKEGIYSSINTPDNLSMGYSHFYAEVMRVKKVAEGVAAGQNMMVIFDELFKGTNVKDAYDATLAVTESLAMYNNCFFIISTHIIEVGEALKDKCDNVQFKYLPTIVEGKIPRYTYKLNEGITNDRQGMMIIENEGILELLSHTA